MVKVLPRNASTANFHSEREQQTAKILTTLKRSSEEGEAAALAHSARLPYVDLHIFPIETERVALIPEGDATSLGISLFQKRGKEIRIAILDPNRQKALDYIRALEDREGLIAKLYVASRPSLEHAWNAYKKPVFLDYLDHLKVNLSDSDLAAFEQEFGNLIALKNRILEIPTTQVLETIMVGAIKLRSSDIHLEPEEQNEIRLRYRIDGVLQDIGRFPASIYPLLLSRVKMLGKMKLNIRDKSQDGHFSLNLDSRKIDIRVSSIPGNFGESLVMRLLDQETALQDISTLGLRGLAYEQVERAFQKPTGIVLNTGPTGSGKTTTLYAILRKLNTPETKIITIEDPIEYEIPNITQTQVSKSRNYTFAMGLRSIVRQDPDIILVGEIRDDETANIAVNAGLTGHLVLSTLHTNNAAGSVARLVEMGVRPNTIPNAVNAFIAQRLVRILCSECKESYEPAEETSNSLKEILSLISPKAKIDIPKDIQKLWRPKGCLHCNGTGYKGRIGIFEVLTLTDVITEKIVSLTSENDIMKEALEEGMVTMAQDGILKAVSGDTSLDEVWRVTGQTEFLEDLYDQLMSQTLARAFPVGDTILKETRESLVSFDRFGKLIENAEQREALKYVFAGALLTGANDIHIEPQENSVDIRFRIDGVLQTVATLPMNEYPSILGDIKLLSGLKTEERAGVRDSRFMVKTESPLAGTSEQKFDIRVSIILGGFGETVVMRLLNRGAVALDIKTIGVREQTLHHLLDGMKKPTGIILNTGPTGSGKTTTLYSLIDFVKTPETKIITVEDPIEYQLSGILQTQVNEEGGYTFSSALRSLLRQNPNIVMIGEIRDDETAEIAFQAALTGHLVIATLHTNNAAGSIPRLISMGVRPDDIVNAGGTYMAQRLVRKLCTCKKRAPLDGALRETVEKVLRLFNEKSGVAIPEIPNEQWIAGGCEKCSNTGYKKRLVLSEVLEINKDIQHLIMNGALNLELEEAAIRNGMITMLMDGVLRALDGETSLEEVLRVVHL
ncbi:MAG: type II/IV secretion system protein [Candidatus Moraniibacteriota bacterium]|nr:MAG: type II/IV secretion system protein [Candidatus Moranbacteria bacterium]